MLISNVHKSIIVMNSLDTRFSKNVFEAVQKTRSTCFIGSKTTRLRLVVLNPIKHSCSFFKHYLNDCEYMKVMYLNHGNCCSTADVLECRESPDCVSLYLSFHFQKHPLRSQQLGEYE